MNIDPKGLFGVKAGDDSWLLKINLETHEVEIVGEMADIGPLFWRGIDGYAKQHGNQTISVIFEGNTVIEIDPEHRTILHEIWDPTVSSVLSELERYGSGS